MMTVLAEGCMGTRSEGNEDAASKVWRKAVWSQGADDSHEDLLGQANVVVVSTEVKVFKEFPEGRGVAIPIGGAALEGVGNECELALLEVP